ncbi:MAG TPA: cytochrome P450 [Nostocaceae cyanobacterium]|nr:cytochrome P450 [Nostocaceae cyanobacterium]
MKSPATPNIPKFIQRLQWVFNPLQLLETSSQQCGEIFTLSLVKNLPLVILSNPQAIQEVFTSSLDKFDAQGSGQVLQPLLGSNSLILLSGTTHQRQRKLLTPPFYGERMKSYGEIITNITQAVINNLPLGKSFDAREVMQEISLRVILEAVFGISEGERFNQLQKLLGSVLDLSGSPLRAVVSFFPALQIDLGAWSPWGKFLRQMQTIDQQIYTVIQERRDNPDQSRTDILSLMMSARDENGEAMTDVELRDELMTLLVAGHETTASALTWALYWIHKLPNVQEKLLVDLENIGENTNSNDIYRLPYLTAVCQETLRIYPILMLTIPRIVQEPTEILGYNLQPGTFLSPCIYLVHHRSDLYPEPKQFKPERFLERQYSPYEYLPFGGGHRRCLGMAFAMFEMKLVLATILSNLDFALADQRPVKPSRRGITLAPSGGKWLVATGKREKVKKVVGV